jgi:hypothetical protein
MFICSFRKTEIIIPDIQDRKKLIMHEGDLPLVLINNIIDKNMHLECHFIFNCVDFDISCYFP